MRSPDERIVALLQEARTQLEAERNRRSEPIAIVGMGCRFPGGASSPNEFWRLLEEGFDATSEVPAERWAADAFYDPNPEAPGKTYTKRGAFLREDVAGFDAEFFGISPREASGMDPQQRLLLEVAWEALEDAGIAPERLRGSATGVWVGLCSDDYARRSVFSGDVADIEAYNALGNTRSIAAGRISYVLDLRGPTLQLDTACSSSLVAIHQACQSLRSRECNLGLVAGVNLMLAPETTIALSKLRALAPDGRCKAFDASADGFGRGEGCGVVVLERLQDARAAGHRILALVRGSAVNHDGHSNGLTAPSGPAQEAVIGAALANAGVAPADVAYVEAHGTGSLLGDQIELMALSRAYRQQPTFAAPLYVGSVKTNLGNLEGAGGVAGLIKLVLCLSRGRWVPHLHLRQPNPKVPWSSLPVRVTTHTMGWPSGGKARIAAVSTFGISGTNAHVVVEEAPADELPPAAPARSAELLVLSAKTAEALTTAASKLREQVEAEPEIALGDLAFSLATTRSAMAYRLALAVPTRESLLEELSVAAAGQTPSRGARSSTALVRGKRAWVFSAQTARRPGIGRELYAEWPAFRCAFDEACALLDPLLVAPVRQAIWPDSGASRFGQPIPNSCAVPALFALQWALAALWRSWGAEPDFVLGEASGEIAAAAVADIFSLRDAARLVCARARLGEEPRGESLRQVAESIVYQLPRIGMLPHTTAGVVEPAVLTSAEYWMRERAEAGPRPLSLEALARAGADTLLELGPEPTLDESMPASLRASGGVLLSSLRPSRPEPEAILEALGAWFVRGGNVDWHGVFPLGGRRIPLPLYAWQRKRYWIDSSVRPGPAPSPAHQTVQELLDALAPEEREPYLIDILADEVAQVLPLQDRRTLSLDAALGALGMDSLMAVQLRLALGKRLSLPSSAHFGLDSAVSSVRSLAAQLVAMFGAPGGLSVQSSLDLPADARLGAEVQGLRALATLEPTSALLTGATGFLGAFLLSELLQQTDARITCLVRAKDPADGMQRLEKNLVAYGLPVGLMRGRVSVVTGDLALPRLGLSAPVFQQLAGQIDAIYNNGAHVSFVAPYRDLKPSHIDATREVLRLASQGRPKAVHHISSIGVFEAYRGQTVTESTVPTLHDELRLPYSQCKWVSEAMVREAGVRGIPFTIHRPAFITGTVDGVWNTTDFLCRFLKGAAIDIGCVPADIDVVFDTSPVDFVARAIVHLSRQPRSVGKSFHLQHPAGMRLRALPEILRSFGYPLDAVPHSEWLEKLRQTPDSPVHPLLFFFVHRWPPENLTYLELSQSGQRADVNSRETMAALAEAGIHCPPLDRALLQRYLTFLASRGFLAPPRPPASA